MERNRYSHNELYSLRYSPTIVANVFQTDARTWSTLGIVLLVNWLILVKLSAEADLNIVTSIAVSCMLSGTVTFMQLWLHV